MRKHSPEGIEILTAGMYISCPRGPALTIFMALSKADVGWEGSRSRSRYSQVGAGVAVAVAYNSSAPQPWYQLAHARMQSQDLLQSTSINSQIFHRNDFSDGEAENK